MKLVVREWHRGYGLRRNIKTDVKPTWTVSLESIFCEFCVSCHSIFLVENTNWGSSNKTCEVLSPKNGKGVREKQLLRWLGNTVKKAKKLWPGCVGVTARRWDGEQVVGMRTLGKVWETLSSFMQIMEKGPFTSSHYSICWVYWSEVFGDGHPWIWILDALI